MSVLPLASSPERRLAGAIALLVMLYAMALGAGWIEPAAHGLESTTHAKPDPPALWSVIPFAALLAAIAVFPLLGLTHHWWENNANRLLIAVMLGMFTLAYYALAHAHPIEQHVGAHALVEPGTGAVSWAVPATVLQNAMLGEYIPFIVLLFALYTISGGIRISGDLPAHPATNAAFLLVGGLLASVIGTTGAAMLLIRPLLETNAERKHVRHTVVFFIFIVCNCGGCLLPIGDPPLFLGYLEGVEFLWTLSLWKAWGFVNLSLVAIYYAWDRWFAYPRESRADVRADEQTIRRLTFSGAGLNGPLLAAVVVAVATLDPGKPFPGTHWHAWPWLREIVQLTLTALSLAAGGSAVRRANRFSFSAIIEVAALFLGIFICMQPALAILDVHGSSLGIDSPAKFFWITGGISAVLDNAPTYLVFFKTAQTLSAEGPVQAGVAVELLQAISLGAVFMGALTYIGNGPNFMVKAIAEESGVKMPSFFGYLLYSTAVLLPLLAITQWLFL